MRIITTLFFILSLSATLARPPYNPLYYTPAPAPPAGRALLSRGADLEPYDFPPSPLSPSAHPILGPPRFWTEPSLHAHYLSTLHLRYHPLLYPTPPPFPAWFKEQQLIRAINFQSQSIELELYRPDATLQDLLEHEMQLAELSILLRQLQIATVLEYASLDGEWRAWEESMYRHWAGFLEVSQREREQVRKGEGRWEKHWAWLQEVVRRRDEEEKAERQREIKAAEEQGARGKVGEGEKDKSKAKEGINRSRGVAIEQGGLQNSAPRREVRANIGEEASSSVRGMMNKAEKGNDEVLEQLRESLAKGLHL